MTTPKATPTSDESQERRWYFINFRQAFGKSGSAYGLARDEFGTWKLGCILPNGDLLQVAAKLEYEDAMRLQDYCCQRDTACKIALMELYEKGNFDPLLEMIERGKALGNMPRRRMVATIEVEIESRGTDDEIRSYLIMHARSASSIMSARVTNLAGPRLDEPRRPNGSEEAQPGN